MRSINAGAMLLAAALSLAGCETLMESSDSQGSSNSPSADSCAFDMQCSSGNCEFGKCSPFRKTGGCSTDSDCGMLEECLGNSCSKRIGACNSDSDCSYGDECTGRSCSRKINGCNFDSDCMSGHCTFGSCM